MAALLLVSCSHTQGKSSRWKGGGEIPCTTASRLLRAARALVSSTTCPPALDLETQVSQAPDLAFCLNQA